MNLEQILAKLQRGDAPDHKWPDRKGEYWALCPFHPDDHVGSFSVSERGYHCFACGAQGSLHDLAQRLGVAVLQRCAGGNTTPSPLSLSAYAQAKRLPVEFLQELGLSEQKPHGRPLVRIPYYNAEGREVAARYRLALAGESRFRWASGSRVLPYGLWKLAEARKAGYLILVEGESDAQTLWFHRLPALGIPGATTWQPEWAQHLQGLAVYLWREPDDGGREFAERVGATLPEVRIMAAPTGRKDISECHILGDDVPALLRQLMAQAIPYARLAQERAQAAGLQAQRAAAPLLNCPDILGEFLRLCRRLGLVGEERGAKLLYLALTSRLLEHPVSVCVKGPSAGGKSFLVETVLKAFPKSAYYALSSMSERSLAYSEEPLAHRFLVLYEAAGLTGDFGTYLMRTLLSEHHIRYETVEKTKDGLKPKLIEREGPTGLIVTTTWASLHPENETRMLSLTVRDDPAQTAAIFQMLADRANGQEPDPPDLGPWHALQTWLELAACRQVTIPYAHRLAELASPAAVRLRRDFGTVLALVSAHALLHQAQRERDGRARVVATLADYAAVHELIADLLDEGAESAVSPALREAVCAVEELSRHGETPVSIAQLAAELGLDKSAASRRVKSALELGYLANLETQRGRPSKLVPGEPLPAERPILPSPATLER